MSALATAADSNAFQSRGHSSAGTRECRETTPEATASGVLNAEGVSSEAPVRGWQLPWGARLV